jgi:hypothetical protein
MKRIEPRLTEILESRQRFRWLYEKFLSKQEALEEATERIGLSINQYSATFVPDKNATKEDVSNLRRLLSSLFGIKEWKREIHDAKPGTEEREGRFHVNYRAAVPAPSVTYINDFDVQIICVPPGDSCWIVEEYVEVPEQTIPEKVIPAHRKKKLKMICGNEDTDAQA